MTTITDLWQGNIAPCEHCGVHDPQLNELFSLMGRHKKSLTEDATVQQRDILEKYADCSEEFAQFMAERAFCDGFCLATRLLTEALT